MNALQLCRLLSATNPTRSVASRAFRHSAATTWNSIPFNIRNCDTIVTFKRRLKKFLFNQAFAINGISAPRNSTCYIWRVISFILLTYLPILVADFFQVKCNFTRKAPITRTAVFPRLFTQVIVTLKSSYGRRTEAL